MITYIKHFSEIGIDDIPSVGGKNASLGEMFNHLKEHGVNVPDGFASTADAYREFLSANYLNHTLDTALNRLDTNRFANLTAVGNECRALMMRAELTSGFVSAITEAYSRLKDRYGEDISLAVRSSATAEDLPNASFAGQQESFLNIRNEHELLDACHRCFASLFTDRAIKYRTDNGFDHRSTALSIGIQIMVRSDLASSGVMFTLDPDSGFRNAILISGTWGLGENLVKGSVKPDEFIVFKPFVGHVRNPIISRRLGTKEQTMIYAENTAGSTGRPADTVINTETPLDRQSQFVLNDDEIIRLAAWGTIIENHYGRPMDIEWAKDGVSGEIYVVQARPETVYGMESARTIFRHCRLLTKGTVLTRGIGLGNRITSGTARILRSPSELSRLNAGDIVVTERTDPDWDPILKKAAAIVTDQGGRTSHAAIVAREVGAMAVIGTGNGTTAIRDGQTITVAAIEGEPGVVYDGKLEWEEHAIDISSVQKPNTRVMLILGHPDEAFRYSFLPNDGVGLMRMEFIVSNAIGIHPMALRHFDELQDPEARQHIARITAHYADKREYFIRKLAESTSVIAAAFHPNDVIVRMSDFKSNEYANLIGGRQFEPHEENPMIGFRGASRYYHPLYREGFLMECEAMKIVREEMGFTNVKLMIPFCRTVSEAEKVIETMRSAGLERGVNGLELYVMIEIPSNALLASEFAQLFDGFSIGSNDLTQLTLGADRDSELLSDIFSPFDPAVMQLIRMAIEKANASGIKIGLCGQAPSDYPEYARFLVECGIGSISFNPDALLNGIENIRAAEQELSTTIIQ